MCKIDSFVVVVLYASVIVSGACIYASTPLMYELGSELAYPVQEGIVGLTLSFVNTGVAIIFLLLLEIPSLGKSIMLLGKREIRTPNGKRYK